MQQFIRNHQADVMGVLSGFDRIRFRGTHRFLATEQGLMNFLWKVQVKLKEFKPYAMNLTQEIRQRIEALAEKDGRPLTYLYSTNSSKEKIAREIARKDEITAGLIGVLSCVEPCFSYEVSRNAKKKHLELRRSTGYVVVILPPADLLGSTILEPLGGTGPAPPGPHTQLASDGQRLVQGGRRFGAAVAERGGSRTARSPAVEARCGTSGA